MATTTAPDVDQTWSQVPGPEPVRTDLPVPLRELLALLVTGVGPVVHSTVVGGGRPRLMAFLAVQATLLLWVLGRRLWPLRLAVVLGTGFVAAASSTGRIGLWMALGALLADWVVRRRPPLPRVLQPPLSAVLPVVVLTAVSAFLGLDRSAVLRPLVPMILALLIAGLSALRPEALASATAAVGSFAGRVISTVLFWLLGLGVVVAPWVVNRLARVDPMRRPTGDVLRERLVGRSVDPTRAWNPESRGETGSTRWRRTAVAAVLLALVAAAVVGVTVLVESLGSEGRSIALEPAPVVEEEDGTPAAMAGSDWWHEYDQDLNWIMQESTAWMPWDTVRVSDVHTRHINVVDGRRVTWQPPECRCERRRVWFYGGSTAFGLGQRDEQTIASWLAKAAWEDGVALEVSNRGNPGDLHWQEANRVAWDLLREPPPDLVVFYDGTNELWSGQYLSLAQLGNVPRPLDLFVEFRKQDVRDPTATKFRTPPGASIPTSTTVVHPDVEFTAGLVMERYAESLALSRTTLRAHSIRGLWIWQPSRFSQPRPNGDADMSTHEPDYRYHNAAAELVPDGVVNLFDLLDDVEGPLFYDGYHHNERAARTIGERMWPHVRDALGIGSGG